jgi:hypothetical protein
MHLSAASWLLPQKDNQRIEIHFQAHRRGRTVGLLFRTAGSYGPVSITPELRGPRHFHFEFSRNITNVRLSMGNLDLYDGPRIESFDASEASDRGYLKIEPRWSGDAFSLKVRDECTLQTFLASFLP